MTDQNPQGQFFLHKFETPLDRQRRMFSETLESLGIPQSSDESITALNYTIVAPQGTVTLETPEHHNLFDNIEEFLKHHEKTIQTLYYGSSVAIGAVTVYLAGKKLKG
jgi:hypothetical protein